LLLPTGRWIARTCACERAAKHEAEAKRERQALLKAMAVRTYGGWLGEGWYDPKRNLSNRTFANYDAERSQEYADLCQMIREERDIAQRKTLNELKHQFEEDRLTWRNALAQAQEFAQHFTGTFLLHGPSGVGKSHLLAAICNTLRTQEQPVSSLFVTAPRFFSAFYDHMKHDNDEWSLVRQAVATPFFVFDDLDKAGTKEFRKEVFYQIIDERCNARKPIGITTNDMEGLPQYIGEAAYSRLMAGLRSVEMRGQDYRMNLMG
jgi:DNA replication protein DnaC